MWPVLALILACGGDRSSRPALEGGTVQSFPDLSGPSQDTRIPLHRTDGTIDLDAVKRVPGADETILNKRSDWRGGNIMSE